MYQIFLVREDTGNGEFKPISLYEWKELIASDSELEYTNTIEYISVHGEKVVRSGQHYAKWTPPGSSVSSYFKFDNGIISTTYDSKNLQKLHEFSNRFSGFVYGELGEEY